MKLSKALLKSYLKGMEVNPLSIEGIRENKMVFYVSLWKEHYLLDERHHVNRFPRIIEVLNRSFDAEEVESLIDGCFAFRVSKESHESTMDIDDELDLFARLKRIGYRLTPEYIHDDGHRLMFETKLGSEVILPVDTRKQLMWEFVEYVESKGYGCDVCFYHRGPVCSCHISTESIKAGRFDFRPSWYRFEITYDPLPMANNGLSNK